MKTHKSINYAYPTSKTAETLGMAKTGCFYVAVSIFREGSSWSPPSPAHNAEGFADSYNPDLIALYNETDGEPCPYFLRYGDKQALRAIAATAPAKTPHVSKRSAASKLARSL